ncbi:hypothetical protein AMAG_19386 [Allomyces macrogynus ATCC 38327]|uniref:Nuclear pore complex protein NUP96 C-terminal domain-containing protein n=1 Tax=Allomyces macrogynus (strain ATCC 38327) TaxID=578462 RepID=A0A0L0SVE2_ALLM3|nr:hypothetical protein AMAG_19386 [Allomyces macrogynus ATCC 38327]|eukprot:KNE66319.1 hypothetical protein AMAG_19386 [Allomyces macrogynus ATCC 38327]
MYANSVQQGFPDALVFVEPVPTELPPLFTHQVRHLIYAPHWYDLKSLFFKSFNGVITHDVAALRRSRNLLAATYFGLAGAKRNYTGQLTTLKATGIERVGHVPMIIGECGIPMDGEHAVGDNERKPRIRAITDLPRHWRFADYAPLITAEHSRVLIDLLGVLYDPPAGLDDLAAPPVVHALVTKTRLQQWLATHLAASADRKAAAAIAEGRPLRAVAAWLAAHQLDRACVTATTHAKSLRLAMLIAASAVDHKGWFVRTPTRFAAPCRSSAVPAARARSHTSDGRAGTPASNGGARRHVRTRTAPHENINGRVTPLQAAVASLLPPNHDDDDGDRGEDHGDVLADGSDDEYEDDDDTFSTTSNEDQEFVPVSTFPAQDWMAGGGVYVEGVHLRDAFGRTLQLRGVNLCGNSKLPITPHANNPEHPEFFDTKAVSFSWIDQLDEKHQKLHAPHAIVAVGAHGHFVTFAKHRQNAAAVGRYTSSLPTPDPAPVLSRLLADCAVSRTPRADKDNERKPRIRAITDLPRHWRFADYAPLITAEHSRVLIDLLGVLYDPPAGLDDLAAPPVVHALVTKTRLQQWLATHLAASADRKAAAAIAEGRPLRAVAAWLAAHQLDRACVTATTHAKSLRLAMLIAASAVDPGMVRAHADAIRAAKPQPSDAEVDYLAVLDLLSVGALTRDPTPTARTALVRALHPLSLAESLAVLLAARHDWSIFDAWSTCLDLQVEPGMFAVRSNLDTALVTALVHFAAPRSTDHAARLVAAVTASPDAAVPDLTPAVLVYLGLLALRRDDVPAPVPAVGARLLAQYAASLDAAGRWEWAVLAIMLMGVVPAPAAPNAVTREAWIGELVARNATGSASLTRAERYVVRDLRVTEHSIWLGKALRIEAFLDAKTAAHGGRFAVGAGGAPKVTDRDAALAMFHQCVMHVRDGEGAKQAAWALKERVPDLVLGMKWDEVVKAVVSPTFEGDDGQWPPAVPDASDAAVPPVARVAVAWAHLMRARAVQSDEEVQAWAEHVAEMAREVKARADAKVEVKELYVPFCVGWRSREGGEGS